MKNQKMILLLAGLTTGIIIFLFVIDFILPKRGMVGSVGLLERGRTSLFGTKTSPYRPFNREGKKADQMDVLRDKLNLVTQKLDKVIEIVESLASSRDSKPIIVQKPSRGFESIGGRYEKTFASDVGKEYSHLPSTNSSSGKLITPFTELYNPNKKREKETPSLDIGSLGKDKLPLSNGNVISGGSSLSRAAPLESKAENSHEGFKNTEGSRDSLALNPPDSFSRRSTSGPARSSGRPDEANTSDDPLSSNTNVGNALKSAEDKDSIFPKKPIFGNPEKNHEKDSEAGSADASKSKPDGMPGDSFEKFIGEIINENLGGLTETTPGLGNGNKIVGRSGKSIDGDNGMMSFRSFEFAVPGEIKTSDASEGEKGVSRVDNKAGVKHSGPSFEKEKLEDARMSDAKKENKSNTSVPGSLGLNKDNEHGGKPTPDALKMPLELSQGFNTAKIISFPHGDIHRIKPIKKKDDGLVVGGFSEEVGNGTSGKIPRNNLSKLKVSTSGGIVPLPKGPLYLDDNDTSLDEIEGKESTEDYSSTGNIKLLGVGEEKQKPRIPLIKT